MKKSAVVLAVIGALVVFGGQAGCKCSKPPEWSLEITASSLEMEAGGSITLSAEKTAPVREKPSGNDWEYERSPVEVVWTVTPSEGAGEGACNPEKGSSTAFTSEDPGEYKIVAIAGSDLTDYLYVKVVPSTYLLNIGNTLACYNGGKAPSFTIDAPHLITEISSYNYGEGAGNPAPGTLGLQAADGTVYGPWQCTAYEGQGGVPNATWYAYPKVEVPAGTYTVLNSNPVTWAQNEQSNGLGFCYVKGTPVEE